MNPQQKLKKQLKKKLRKSKIDATGIKLTGVTKGKVSLPDEKLTKVEQWIEDHLEEFIPAPREEFERLKRAIEARRKDAVLNIRINKMDLDNLKQKAKRLGVKYQTFIAEILHKVAEA